MPDPDLKIAPGEGGVVSPKPFSPVWASVWSKNKGGPPPSPVSATDNKNRITAVFNILAL